MTPGQSINSLLSRSIGAVDDILVQSKPDAVVVQGDTSSALAGALSGRFLNIPVVHVEAGLRTGDSAEPFPEEINRRLISSIAALHCAPTAGNCDNLRNEGIDDKTIVVTGNPVVDALEQISKKIAPSAATRNLVASNAGKMIVLATTHRRENFGVRLDGYLRALNDFVHANEDVVLFYPIHPNPNVAKSVESNITPNDRIMLLEPIEYPDFLYLMRAANLIVSDSGGIQEEAASLGTPLLTLRAKTERPEAVTAGTTKLIADPEELENELEIAFSRHPRPTPALVRNPFGDGNSGPRIARAIVEFLADESA